jgi:hypothetical protein
MLSSPRHRRHFDPAPVVVQYDRQLGLRKLSMGSRLRGNDGLGVIAKAISMPEMKDSIYSDKDLGYRLGRYKMSLRPRAECLPVRLWQHRAGRGPCLSGLTAPGGSFPVPSGVPRWPQRVPAADRP